MVNATPRPLYPWEKRQGTHFIGGWVGPRAGLDGCGKSAPTGIWSPDHPIRSESLYRLHPLFWKMPTQYLKLTHDRPSHIFPNSLSIKHPAILWDIFWAIDTALDRSVSKCVVFYWCETRFLTLTYDSSYTRAPLKTGRQLPVAWNVTFGCWFHKLLSERSNHTPAVTPRRSKGASPTSDTIHVAYRPFTAINKN